MTPRTRRIVSHGAGAVGLAGCLLLTGGYAIGLVPLMLCFAVLLPMAYPHVFRMLLHGRRAAFRRLLSDRREIVEALVEASGTPKGAIEGRVMGERRSLLVESDGSATTYIYHDTSRKP